MVSPRRSRSAECLSPTEEVDMMEISSGEDDTIGEVLELAAIDCCISSRWISAYMFAFFSPLEGVEGRTILPSTFSHFCFPRDGAFRSENYPSSYERRGVELSCVRGKFQILHLRYQMNCFELLSQKIIGWYRS